MERFLICPKCSLQGKERYFGTAEGILGPEFQILNTMDRCDALALEEEMAVDTHSIRDTHRVMLKKVPKKAFSLDAFLQDGIEQMKKTPFKELRPGLNVGDQVWVYRGRKDNLVSRVMPYAHVAVYVGNHNVVHVAKRPGCCAGVLMGTIKKVPVGNVIKDDDLGEFQKQNFKLIHHYCLTSFSVLGPQYPSYEPLLEHPRPDCKESPRLCRFACPRL